MNIIPFNFESQQIRVVEINNEPWFVATDIASILEYTEAAAMTRYLDDDEKGLSIVRTLGGEQSVSVINESGLYSAILRSRKPEAKAFKKWVTSDVLPSIRKTGSYSAAELSRKDLALMIIQAEEEKEALLLINKQQEAEISHLHTLFNEGMTPSQFVKKLNGVNCQKVNEFLLAKNWLRHDNHGWRVNAYARDKYLTEKETKITPEGKPSFIKYQPTLLRAGAVRLFDLYTKGKLPMKKTWDGLFTHDKSVEVAA